MRARLALAGLPVLLVAAACGSGKGTASSPPASPSAAPSPTATATAPVTTRCPSGAPTKDLAKKPAVVLPKGSTAPANTTWTDVVVGTGAEARAGSNVQVKYVGVLFDSCQEFDSSWKVSPTNTLGFQVGGGVITGFSKGVEGMRVGGRRQVVIPPQDGYGPEGTGPIPPDATLVFVIDLVKVG